MRTISKVPVGRLRDHVVGHGITALTIDDVVELTGLDRGAAREAIRRARRAGHFFAPAPGLYIPIPSEYSAWGVVPAMDFIDQLMRFLGRSYYVGLLSAAEIHGAAHQRPQAFQVMVDRRVSDRDLERVHLRFYARARLADIPVVQRNSRTAEVNVASPEATVFDIVARPQDSGAIFNVATIIGELVREQKLDAGKLDTLAPMHPLAVVRRLGWLLDRDAEYVDTADLARRLHKYVRAQSLDGGRAVDLLETGGPRQGPANAKWGLVENADVEPDL